MFIKNLGEFSENLGGYDFFCLDGKEGANKVLPTIIHRYEEMGYASAEELKNDPLIESSIYFWAKNEKGEIKGTTRLILGEKAGTRNLPAIQHFELYDKSKKIISNLQDRQVAEIGRLAIEKGNPTLSHGLYRQAWQYSWNMQITHWVISADLRLIRILQMPRTRIFFSQMAPDKNFMGSITRAGISSLDNLNRNLNPRFRYYLNQKSPAYSPGVVIPI